MDDNARWLDDGEGSEGIDLNWRPPCVVLVAFLLSAWGVDCELCSVVRRRL